MTVLRMIGPMNCGHQEKASLSEKMKRLQEYDYVRDGTSSTSNMAAISSNNINAVAAAAPGQNMSETSSNTASNRNSTSNKTSLLPFQILVHKHRLKMVHFHRLPPRN
jgi:hypothetical protein